MGDHDTAVEAELLLDRVLDSALGHYLGGPGANGPEIECYEAIDLALQEHLGAPEVEGICQTCLNEIGQLAISRLLHHRLI